MRPLILVSNDDGVDAPGIAALAGALESIAEVITVAPRYEQSAKSHALTLHAPLRHQRLAANVHAIDGTPADCVYVALYREDLLPRRPDLVASGINHGPNLGSDVYYSGTVAAAREAALRGIPSVAFSMTGGNTPLDESASVAVGICARLLGAKHPVDQCVLLNVNFPPLGPFKGLRATRTGLRLYQEGVEVRSDPRGREYYWIGGPGEVRHERLGGSDTDAVDDGYVAITPISLRATHPEHFGIAAYAAGPGSAVPTFRDDE